MQALAAQLVTALEDFHNDTYTHAKGSFHVVENAGGILLKVISINATSHRCCASDCCAPSPNFRLPDWDSKEDEHRHKYPHTDCDKSIDHVTPYSNHAGLERRHHANVPNVDPQRHLPSRSASCAKQPGQCQSCEHAMYNAGTE